MAVSDRLRKILLYGLSRSATDGLLALRGLLLATLLGPTAFGGWVLFRLATNYCGFARLGVNSGLEFHVARSRGDAGAHLGTLFWGTALGFVLLVFTSIALVTLGASFLVGDPTLALGMRWFAGAILTEQVWLVGLSYLRAKGDLRRYAVYELTNAALQLAFAAALTPIWGLAGAFASFVLATAVALALLVRILPMAPALSRARLRQMLKIGLPILVSLVLGFTLASADRMIVAATGEMPLLGLYGFAFAIAGIAGSLAWVIRTVVYPDVYASVASDGEGRALRAHLEGTVLPFARVLPLALGLLAVVMGPIISVAVPEYADAVPAARLLMFVGVTAGFERLGALGVVAAQRQRLLPFFSAAALVLNVSGSILALWAGLGLQGVAAAAVISNAAFGIAALVLLARIADVTRPYLLVIRTAYPLLWCAIVVVILSNVRAALGVSYTLVSLAFYLIAVLPLVPNALSELLKAKWRASRSAEDSRHRPEMRSKTVPVVTTLLLVLSLLVISIVDAELLGMSRRETVVKPSSQHAPVVRPVDLRPVRGIQSLPRYIDLDVEDTIRITKSDGELLEIRVASIEVESGSHASPRTRVDLESGGRRFAAHCGMREHRRGGIRPTDIDDIRVGVEVTRLLFSEMKGGSSPFDTYEKLRLRNDLRLAIWEGSRGIMPGADGRFVVSQPVWARERYGNWLHSTDYGIHSAIDIFATPGGPPEEVLSPVDGTVYRVYNRDVAPDDSRRSKAVNIYGDAIVGPNGEKVLYRFFHFSEILVSSGEKVRRGQVIGLTGHTGFNRRIGDHLHLEMRLNPSHFGLPGDDDIFATIPVNPYPYLLEWYENERQHGS